MSKGGGSVSGRQKVLPEGMEPRKAQQSRKIAENPEIVAKVDTTDHLGKDIESRLRRELFEHDNDGLPWNTNPDTGNLKVSVFFSKIPPFRYPSVWGFSINPKELGYL